MAVLHLAAACSDPSAPLPRLVDWGVQMQATEGMISNITISDVIFESSNALRIIGTVSDVTISRVQFLMLGPATEDVIKLDRIKLGGDGTNPRSTLHGIRFVDCVFDTRNSYPNAQHFFSWRLLLGLNDAWTPNNRVIFHNVSMVGGTRGPVSLFFDSVSYVTFENCILSVSTITATNPIGFELFSSKFDGSGVYMVGNVSTLTVSKSDFLNFGYSKFPGLTRPSSLTFQPSVSSSLIGPPTVYSDIRIRQNRFANFTATGLDPVSGYAAVFFIPSINMEHQPQYEGITISDNDFSHMNPPAAHQGVAHRGSLARPLFGPLAIYSNIGLINAEYNYYGFPTGPASCCNPNSNPEAPRVSPFISWNPWWSDKNRTVPGRVLVTSCSTCSEPPPTTPPTGDNNTMVVILISATLALVVLIVGLTGLYCFTRPKSAEKYALVPADGWRSRLLASVPDVQALFDQFGVPLIQFEDLVLNPIPIGSGSFGRVYDGILANSEHIELHKELHTLMDTEPLTRIHSTDTLHKLTQDLYTPGNSSSDYFFSDGPLPTIEDAHDQHRPSRFLDTLSPPTLHTHAHNRGNVKIKDATAKVDKKSNSKKSKKKEAPRPIAVKELNSNITDSYEDINQFLEEIKIMASIDHPNLLKLRGVAIDPDSENILLVMDLMDLGSLEDVIFKKKIPLTFARKLAIATEIGYALHYLHSKEPAICHRDLKPGNVLVSRKWNVKVCDFGSSRVLDRKSATMTIKGTPIYLAPESINSSKFSEKTDVYSYGVTLVELFGGTRAFDDIVGSAANLMYRIAAEGLRPTIPSDLPVSLKSLIRRCMATNPDDRPNFTDILEKLAEVRAASADSASSSAAPAGDHAYSSEKMGVERTESPGISSDDDPA